MYFLIALLYVSSCHLSLPVVVSHKGAVFWHGVSVITQDQFTVASLVPGHARGVHTRLRSTVGAIPTRQAIAPLPEQYYLRFFLIMFLSRLTTMFKKEQTFVIL